MSASVVLLAFAVAVAVVVPVLLGRATWLEFSPRVGIVLWQLATVSALVSFVAAAATLCLTLWSGATPAAFLRTCVALLGQGEIDSPMMLIGSAGVMAAAAAGLRLACCAGRTALGIRREWSRQRRRLALLAHRAAVWPDAVVIDRLEATAFCLPRRRGGTVVLSTGTLARLAPAEVQAVLAGERSAGYGRGVAARLSVGGRRFDDRLPGSSSGSAQARRSRAWRSGADRRTGSGGRTHGDVAVALTTGCQLAMSA